MRVTLPVAMNISMAEKALQEVSSLNFSDALIKQRSKFVISAFKVSASCKCLSQQSESLTSKCNNAKRRDQWFHCEALLLLRLTIFCNKCCYMWLQFSSSNGITVQKPYGLPSPERSGSPELKARSSQWYCILGSFG